METIKAYVFGITVSFALLGLIIGPILYMKYSLNPKIEMACRQAGGTVLVRPGDVSYCLK